jgi:hypothetical protein
VRLGGALEKSVVKIAFDDNQMMTISYEPLSDCRADEYPTVSGTSFSMPWRIEREGAKALTQQ